MTVGGEDDAARRLLAWYDVNRRDLSWRAAPGAAVDPYRVWLSEIMLQQTTVATVSGRFPAFVARWPTLAALAGASLDEVLHGWQGLGYYSRARNLHRCARALVAGHGGRFPDDEAALGRLPGIGAYTAAAIAAIAFGRPAVVVDGNVERVMARLHAVDEPLPGAKRRLRGLAAALTPSARPGDYAQAVMDLGATVCRPRAPRCEACPWAADCAGLAAELAESLPRRAPKAPRPLRRGTVFWLERDDGAVLLRRRPTEGLLGGLMEVPSGPWLEPPEVGADGTVGTDEAGAPVAAGWRLLPGTVAHVFTHFRLELRVLAARLPEGANPAGTWCPPDRLDRHALPTVMRKVIRHATGDNRDQLR